VNLASLIYPLPPLSQATLVDQNYARLALALYISEDVPLIPSPDDIEKVNIEALSSTIEESACNRYHAILFVILDAVGIGQEFRDVVVELVRDTPVQTKLDQLVDGYPNRNWEDTARNIVDLILLIGGLEFMVRLRNALGEQVIQAMSRKMSLYLVPYAGWIFGVIVICASVKKNWDLLVC
jgi:hypothetical protein